MNKVEGKVGDFCLNCKNCKAVTRAHDGETASIRIIEVECVDPYDGMVKILDADSDICCSMFEPKPACEKCERFDGTYCHSPEGIFVTSYMATGNCSFYSEKKEKEPCDEISCLQHELEMDKLRSKIHELEKEKAAHLKGIERLKKSQEKLQNQVKNLQTTNEESYKREEKLEEKFKEANEVADSWKRDYERLRDQFVHPIYNILYPDNPNLDINVTALLDDVKNLKIYAGENKSMYEDLKYWRERCHKAETDVTILNSKVEVLENKLRKVDSIRDAVWNEKELKQKISDLTEANENLTKAVERRDRWVEELKSDVDTLQNEILRIRNIAQKAYDDTNRD